MRIRVELFVDSMCYLCNRWFFEFVFNKLLITFSCVCSATFLSQKISGLFFCFFFKTLFIHETGRERGRDLGRGRSRLPVGSPIWDLIPGPRYHSLSQGQDAQLLSHPGVPIPGFMAARRGFL